MAGGRKYLRAKVGVMIRWQVPGTGEWRTANLEDLSVAGARFSVNHELFKGCRIKTEIVLSGGAHVLELPAVVNRCVRKIKEAGWSAAIQFIQPTQAQTAALVQLIHDAERENRIKRKEN